MAFTTFLVDDDPSVLKALSRLMRTAGYESRCYSSARDFLRDHDCSVPGCAIIDLTMPDIDGLMLQEKLGAENAPRPIIFLTGNGDIPTSVRAMKAGAVDFLTKPARSKDLLSAVERAREQDTVVRQTLNERHLVEERLGTLTPREREVLGYVVAGLLNKQIAAEIGTVEKTVKVHRGRMMAKLGVHSVVGLMRLMERVGDSVPSRP